MRSRADFLERKEIIQKKLNTLHKTSGSVHILGLMKGTNITVATYSYCYNSKVAIILATPDNELYAIPFHPKLGTVGMKATATNCRDREYPTNISANNIVIKSIRIAEAIMTITPPARGSSYSGEKELTEEEKRELKKAGKAGALDATFEDFRFVERLA